MTSGAVVKGVDFVQYGVDDLARAIDELLSSLRQRGVRVVFGPIDTPVCRMGMIADSEGNHLIIHRRNDGTFG